MSKHSLRLLVLAAIFLCKTVAFAQDYQGTSQQRAACTSDAFRLCASYIPDATKVETCLRTRKSDLSAACRSVFSQNSASVVGANQ